MIKSYWRASLALCFAITVGCGSTTPTVVITKKPAKITRPRVPSVRLISEFHAPDRLGYGWSFEQTPEKGCVSRGGVSDGFGLDHLTAVSIDVQRHPSGNAMVTMVVKMSGKNGHGSSTTSGQVKLPKDVSFDTLLTNMVVAPTEIKNSKIELLKSPVQGLNMTVRLGVSGPV